MKRTSGLGVAASLVVALVAACSDVTAPGHSQQYLLLSGVWEEVFPTPGGSYMRIATYAANGEISGIGVAYSFTNDVDSLKIGGQYSADGGSFGLSISSASGKTATFSGTVQGTASLSGNWTDWSSGSSIEITFTRMPVPPCPDSAPLLGTYNPAAPGFIVRFQDSVDATTEAARLASTYDFTTTHVYAAAISGFAADLSTATMTVLRCEPKVISIEYDNIATTGGPTSRP